jgi:DNA polymerase
MMPHSKEFNILYASVMTCASGCDGVRNDPVNGYGGRSFYCRAEHSGVEILLVSKNPGQCHPDEAKIYAPLNGPERVRVHEDFVRNCFTGGNALVTSRYHANIIRWVSIILGVPEAPDEVFSRAVLTQLVKCESAGHKTDSLPNHTKDACADRYLYREIELLRPKYLLALGSEAYKYLARADVADKHRLPVGELYHPSWTNMRGGEARYIAEKLPQLREQYLRAIAT